MNKKLIIIDANALLFRLYHAYKKGREDLNVTGLVLNNFIKEILNFHAQASHLFIAWDGGSNTFRKQAFSDYKSNREKPAEDLIELFALTREFITVAKLFQFESTTYEADDLIGSVTKQFQGIDKLIVSADGDLFQLLKDDTKYYHLKDKKIYTQDNCIVKSLVKPSQVTTFKALSGDASDRIPGVKGVGKVTATTLINQYDNLDNIYSKLDQLKPRLQKLLIESKEDAYLSLFLATIVTDVELEFGLEDLVVTDIYSQELIDFYQRNNLKKLLTETEVKTDYMVQETEFKFKDINKNTIFYFHGIEDALFYNDSLQEVYFINQESYSKLSVAAFNNHLLLQEYLKNNSIITFDAQRVYHYFQGDINIAFDVRLALFLTDSRLTSIKDILNQNQIKYQKKTYLLDLISILYRLYNKAYQELQLQNLETYYYDIELKLAYQLYLMEIRGIKIDETKWTQFIEPIADKVKDLQAQIASYTDININSPSQLASYLYDELDLAHAKNRSTSMEHLDQIKDSHPIVNLIIEYRYYFKFYSSTLLSIKDAIINGHLYPSFNQTAAATGRIATHNPNLQTINIRSNEFSKVRSAIIARDGYKLLSLDYSQIELRIIADLTQDPRLIEAFNLDKDIHSQIASLIFQTAEPEYYQRNYAKMINYSIIYGSSIFSLAQNLNLSYDQAKLFYQRYFDTFPKVKAYMDHQKNLVGKQEFVETLFKRRRYLESLEEQTTKTAMERIAINSPIQGSCSDIMKLVMVKIGELLSEYQSKMILQIHDELLFEIKDEEVGELVPKIKSIMEESVKLSVKLKVDYALGDNYLEL